jgi:CheY-like chemotaxis protein
MANILVVDDQPVNREVLATLLQSQGHTILEASMAEKRWTSCAAKTPIWSSPMCLCP